MTDAKKYTGGCHCGKVRFEVTMALHEAMACNCSICSKRGLLIAPASKDQFRLLSGEGELVSYQFARKRVHHFFCPVCGVQSFSSGSGRNGETMYAVNVRCLDEVDVAALTVKPFDGKSL
jgi:hypothetical protein